MKSDWHQHFYDTMYSGKPYVFERGIVDCQGRTMAQVHVEMHRLGVRIDTIQGYKNLDLGGGPSVR